MKHKVKGMYRRASGIYYTDFIYKTQRVGRSLRTRDYGEAVKRLGELRRQLEEDEIFPSTPPKCIKLSQALERACREHFKNYADKKTPQAHVKRLIEIVGDLALNKLSAKHINKMRQTLLEQGVANSTVNKYMGHLRVMLRLARDEWEEVESIPDIPKYRETGSRKFILSLELEEQILQWMQVQEKVYNPYLKVPWADYADLAVVLMDTGLRLSEALQLERTDIYENQLIVRPEISKGRKVRGVPLSVDAYSVLTRRVSLLDSKKTTLIFGKITTSGAMERMRKVKQAFNLGHTDFGWHSLRHTCATRLIRAGANIAVVQEWLGHSSISTTMNYVKLVDEMKDNAMLNMTRMFKRGSNQ